MSTSAMTVWTAKFRGLKRPNTNPPAVLACELEMLLVPSMVRPHLYFIEWGSNRKCVDIRPRSLAMAKEYARQLFVEQVTEWSPRE